MKLRYTLLIFLTRLTLGTAQDIESELNFVNREPFEQDGKMKGSGVIAINPNSSTYGKDFIIYDDQENPKIIIHHDENDVTTKYKNQVYTHNNSSNPFQPKLFGSNPDYFRLLFNCLGKTDKYYKVIINEMTEETGLIRVADKKFIYQTYLQYIEEWTSTGFDFDRINNPLRIKPTDKSTIIGSDLLKKYKIWRAQKLKIDGDWIKVKVDKTEGWIKWRKGNNIIIKLYFTC
jgi:hypothetical protein